MTTKNTLIQKKVEKVEEKRKKRNLEISKLGESGVRKQEKHGALETMNKDTRNMKIRKLNYWEISEEWDKRTNPKLLLIIYFLVPRTNQEFTS